ncbi:PRD domain-containing protein [Microbacterium oleivorans]|uniref:PRD domain-containing protein n=1 Tax=Microbacterium oleivorans TaxID=273677 RepID=A0A7D5JEE4_9MICO|nr:PRD domain-containing protein [Microbacterium oleivorans]QLD12800.1 PRD domain-containing protein [Microbacterium oleivorans]
MTARPPSAPHPVSVVRIFNNNVLLCRDGPDEIVVVGKGLGYTVKPGGELDASAPGLKRFVPDQQYAATHVAEMLSDATMEEADVAEEIVRMAESELGTLPTQRVLLPLLDHLSFAVERAKGGITVDYPLQWETGQVFPQESAVGRRAVQLVRDRLGVSLQEGEWSAFALHFVTHRWAGGDLTRSLSMTGTISRVFREIEETWDTRIDQTSMSAARFVAHLRYLWARVSTSKQLRDSPVDFMGDVNEAYPEAAAAAVRSAAILGAVLGAPLTQDEVAYLALHTSRLYVDATQ